jgi:hemerythrin-like metal-binding protein
MPLSFPEELAVGVPEVDDQHRELYRHIGDLHAAMRVHDLAEVSRIADFLEGYATIHFAAEERLMIAAGYSGLPDHVLHHRDFVKDLKSWQARFARKGPTPSLVVELSAWLTGWLGNHIRKVDGPMAQFLRTLPPRR